MNISVRRLPLRLHIIVDAGFIQVIEVLENSSLHFQGLEILEKQYCKVLKILEFLLFFRII